MATTSGLVLTGALVAIGFGRSATTPLMMLLLMETDAVGPGRMGTAAGLYFTVGELGGFAGPAVIGLLLNATGGFLIPLGALAALLLVAALTSLGIVERSRTPVPAELLIIEAAGKV
jgi:predicted MFS family arabinose efflux permease